MPASRRVRPEQRTAEGHVTLPPLPELPPLPVLPGAEPATKRGFGSGAGRKLGQRDKVTLALKEAILLAAEEVGDRLAEAEPGRMGGLAGYLTMVASTDVKSFCSLLGRVLPMTIKGEGEGGGIVVEIVKRTYGAQDAAG